jgi:hypothetical protein
MSKWEEVESFDSKVLVVHEPGTFNHIEELRDKVVVRAVNIMDGQVWLIPLTPDQAVKVGTALIAYSDTLVPNK